MASMDPSDDYGGAEEDFSMENLRRAVLNEIFSPELLPFEPYLVDYLTSQIEQRSSLHDTVESIKDKKIADIFRLDAERVKYYLQLYLRCRLFKIDKYHVSLLASEEMTERMSEAEAKYAKSYKTILNRHFTESFLKELPERLRGTEEVKADVNMVPEPDLEKPVFCHVLQDIGKVALDGQILDMRAGNVIMLKYKNIRPFLLEKKVELR